MQTIQSIDNHSPRQLPLAVLDLGDGASANPLAPEMADGRPFAFALSLPVRYLFLRGQSCSRWLLCSISVDESRCPCPCAQRPAIGGGGETPAPQAEDIHMAVQDADSLDWWLNAFQLACGAGGHCTGA